jgi:ribokinase
MSVAPEMVVVGSVNTDLVVILDHLPAPGETVSGGRFERHGGGKGANQAVAAARVGARVRFVGAVGDDDLGHEAVALLKAEGIDVAGVARSPDAPTGVALITVDARGENQIAVASGANATLGAAEVERAVRGALGSGSVCLSNLEIGDDAISAGFAAARRGGARLILNPAPARPVPDEILDLGPMLTPNEGEARRLSGEDVVEDAARALARRTGAPAIVTLGAEGALLCDGPEVARAKAFSVEVVDTTGAGDAFNGILASRLARGASVRAALPYALAGAALAVTVAGARAGMPSLDEVERLLRART